MPPKEFADPAKIRIPFQGHFANDDGWVTPAVVDDLEATLKKTGVKFEIYRYDAKHAFCNERRPEVYNADAAEKAWERTLKFLGANL